MRNLWGSTAAFALALWIGWNHLSVWLHKWCLRVYCETTAGNRGCGLVIFQSYDVYAVCLILALVKTFFAQIGLLVKEFGGAWATEKLFPSAFTIYDKSANYLHRMACLQIVHVRFANFGNTQQDSC